MLVQAIVYSLATGRVRYVHDAQRDLADPTTFYANLLVLKSGEGLKIMTKRAATPQRVPSRGNNTLHDWQAIASLATKLRPVPMHPDVDAHVVAAAATNGVALTDVQDRYVIVSPENNILKVVIADPACGDSGEHFGTGNQLIAHPHADERWTYSNGVFTGPTIQTKSGPVVMT